MNKTTLVNLFNRSQHLNKDLNDNLERVVRLKTTPRFSEINPHKVHNNQVLLRVVYEVIYIRNMRTTFIELRRARNLPLRLFRTWNSKMRMFLFLSFFSTLIATSCCKTLSKAS
jgi:hypothetical protein